MNQWWCESGGSVYSEVVDQLAMILVGGLLVVNVASEVVKQVLWMSWRDNDQ